MATLALVSPWDFRLLKSSKETEREIYLSIRRTRGPDAAEHWRTSVLCLRPKELERDALPLGTWDVVRRRFGKYAERYEDLTEAERRVVEGVLAERIEREKEATRVRPFRHRTRVARKTKPKN